MKRNATLAPFITLGDLVCAAFDRAAEASGHPVVVSALVTRCVDLILEGLGRRDLKRQLARSAPALESGRPRMLRLIAEVAPSADR